MKTFIIISVICIATACQKNKSNQLPDGDVNAVAEMSSDYKQAKLYNDSLAMCYAQNNSFPDSMKHHFDHLYHHYDSLFEDCHSKYEHTYTTADHSHNTHGNINMHNSHNGGMMMNVTCPCCTNGGHAADVHNQINSLHNLHSSYHPH